MAFAKVGGRWRLSAAEVEERGGQRAVAVAVAEVWQREAATALAADVGGGGWWAAEVGVGRYK